MSNDKVSDLLTRVRNAQMRKKYSVLIPYFKMGEKILKVLEEEGFIGAVSIREPKTSSNEKDNKFPLLSVRLRYYDDGAPAITHSRRISKSGRRVYKRTQDLKPVCSGLGISIVSTSQGLMTDRDARKRNIGGEVIGEIW
jgi:small subunit ribosomal protein S8